MGVLSFQHGDIRPHRDAAPARQSRRPTPLSRRSFTGHHTRLGSRTDIATAGTDTEGVLAHWDRSAGVEPGPYPSDPATVARSRQ